MVTSTDHPMMTQQPPQKLIKPVDNRIPLCADNLVEADMLSEVGKASMVGLTVGVIYARAFGWWVASSRPAMMSEMKTRGALLAGLGGAFSASSIFLAKIRHTDDFWNTAFGGAVVGLLNGVYRRSPAMAFGQAALFGFMGGYASWSGRETERSNQYRLEDRRLTDGQNFFAWPKPDPFAQRIAEIQARDEKSAE
ncbi:hypothetical protein BATDEDRAFT_91355 [Batrachochytrium dendrobatidis JAM81]|uniref:Uncharacterized protein n=2 Tax=Batrachochytrium dendrobatidis TaxID=109871 RepID=F4PAJ9_BATDJ|nr:uncharacterized protein BATDEDRAFT_91355 [Batrachochytrium dendrobatidis JAM81]EGF77699.1 hypothetical protein BATDEDRAFT_91355 [Batrachochytrium dendrobatidis JAM81]|eukprot:XP_006681807.1 hypothetical protein BATDEDRAFT_91355 [Batrachochytrium dendrobatidis JAM81]